MRSLLTLAALFPAIVLAQTQEDYIKMMSKFVKYYNNHQPDSICKLFKPKPDIETGCVWTWFESKHKGQNILADDGKIIDYAYLGKDTTDPNDVGIFKVVYKKRGKVAMSFNLDEHKQFGTFRRITSSPEIDAMLKNSK